MAYLVALDRGKASRLPPTKMLVVLVGFIVLMGLDGLNAVAYDLYWSVPYEPNLYLRSATGLFAGLAVAGILWPVFNQTIWRNDKTSVSLSGWRDLAGAIALMVIFWVAGLSGWNLLLYPISIITITGQVALLLCIVTIIIMVALRREGQAVTFPDLAPWLRLGLVIVALALGTSAAVRYTIFGPGPLPTLR